MQSKQQAQYIIYENNTALFAQGKAKIYTKYHQKNAEGQTVESEVFYNPVQVFNRDLSILVMQGYIDLLQKQKGPKFQPVNIVDALSASGLRTIRYLKQLKNVKKVIANDILPAANKLMTDNFNLNKLAPQNYDVTLQDANILMREGYKTHNGFDIIDLDPYGSVVPFLDAAVGSVRDGGLLCITCTDTRVLCGPDLSKCYYYYGTVRAKVQDFNENALRILLSTVSSAASRHCKFIEPMLSLQTDFYVRVFVRVRSGKKQCGESGSKIGNIYNCQFCGNYESRPYFKPKANHFVPERTVCSSVECEVCKHPLQMNGPVWLGRINNVSFVEGLQEILNEEGSCLGDLHTKKKINGVLHGIVSENEMGLKPLAFNFQLICKNLHSTGLSRANLFNAIKSLGSDHVLTPSYLSPSHYKSSLPMRGIYDIVKAWKMRSMGEEKYLNNVKSDYALHILKSPRHYQPDFQFKSEEKYEKVPRWISLGKGLGPKGKAGKRVIEQQNGEKQQKIERKGSKGEKREESCEERGRKNPKRSRQAKPQNPQKKRKSD